MPYRAVRVAPLVVDSTTVVANVVGDVGVAVVVVVVVVVGLLLLLPAVDVAVS